MVWKGLPAGCPFCPDRTGGRKCIAGRVSDRDRPAGMGARHRAGFRLRWLFMKKAEKAWVPIQPESPQEVNVFDKVFLCPLPPAELQDLDRYFEYGGIAHGLMERSKKNRTLYTGLGAVFVNAPVYFRMPGHRRSRRITTIELIVGFEALRRRVVDAATFGEAIPRPGGALRQVPSTLRTYVVSL